MQSSLEIEVDGTSWHGVTIVATLQDMLKILGEDYESTDKTTHDWHCKTNDGEVFTVYNWKSGRPTLNQKVTWNIGGHSKESTEKAKRELSEAL